MLRRTIRSDDFSATYCCNIVPTLLRMIAALPILQRRVALIKTRRSESSRLTSPVSP